MSRSTVLLVLAAALAVHPAASRAEGKYARRQRLRGETTDTSPKLDRYAYVNDAKATPQGLVLVADTYIARAPADDEMLPLVVALSYEGRGPGIPIRPDRFRLSWDDAPPVAAVDQRGLVEAEQARGNLSPVYRDMRTLSFRQPLSFDTPNAHWVGVQFHSHPALPGLVHDHLNLPPQRWFETLAYFPLPAGFARWDALFTLAYVPEDGQPPAVTVTFRIQRDPALQQRALRRAQKDVERENKRRP